MTEQSWQQIRSLIQTRANNQCEYCLTSGLNIGQALHVEHIDPAGGDNPDNLCLACPNCNLSKSAATEAVDLESGQHVALFHPRRQDWREHFEWTEEYTEIQGKTPTGRATFNRLRMNRPRMVLTRQRWVRAGLHPIRTNISDE